MSRQTTPQNMELGSTRRKGARTVPCRVHAVQWWATPVCSSMSLRSVGCVVLMLLEKYITVLSAFSRWERVLCKRQMTASSTPYIQVDSQTEVCSLMGLHISSVTVFSFPDPPPQLYVCIFSCSLFPNLKGLFLLWKGEYGILYTEVDMVHWSVSSPWSQRTSHIVIARSPSKPRRREK